MTEKIKAFGEKCKETLKKFPRKLYIAAATGLVLTAILIAVVVMNQPYSVLFTQLSQSEASTIMTYLDEQGVTSYKLEGTDTILVPKSQEMTLRAKLIQMGYPKTGVSYSSYYDNVGALSTESERTQAYLLSVAENMGTVIRMMDGVENATVMIQPGQDRSYVLDSGNMVQATATIMVTMQDGKQLSSKMAASIRNFVAYGIQGLEMESVSLIDNMGNQYSGYDDAAAGVDASQLKLALEEEHNNKIRREILWVLEPFFGEENVRVSVNCTVDVNRVEENATNVYLPEWANDGSTNGEGIIGSKIYDNYVGRDGDTTVGGVVGTQSNADLNTYVERELNPDGTEKVISSSGQVDYDNPRSETHTVRVAGYLTDCMVSVSINRTTAGAVDVASLLPHVARAAGIQESVAEEKINILPMAFYAPPAELPIGFVLPFPTWYLYIAGGILLLLIVMIILIARSASKKRKKKLEEDAQRRMAEEVMAITSLAPGHEPTKGADVMSMQTERSMELRKDIRKFVDENPEIAAQMVKAWLRGGEEDG